MATSFKRVYQFRVELKGIAPPIWRTIQVPETYSFWDLHVAIQDAMGWLDYHLHQFDVVNPETGVKEGIGIPDEEFGGDGVGEVLPGWKKKIASYFSADKPAVDYSYDFGDGWVHEVRLEKILPREKGVRYPVCIAGKRACPPEDCGGVWGYQNLLEILSDPGHKEHASTLDWLGGRFDPEAFDAEDVRFDDPKERWRLAFK